MMINYNHSVVVFLLLSLGICSENNVTAVKCIKSEREALLRFKEGVIDFPGKLSSWVGDGCCQWKGVECDESDHVIKLNLSNPAGRHRHFDYYEGIQNSPVYDALSKNRRVCVPAGCRSARLLGKITFTLVHLKYLKVFEFLNFLAC